MIFLYGLASVAGHAPSSLCFYFTQSNLYQYHLCTSGTPTCQKSKSGGLYHLVMSRFSACSVADILLFRNLNLLLFSPYVTKRSRRFKKNYIFIKMDFAGGLKWFVNILSE